MKNFDGKNVVVTGGSYGIGKEIARAFIKEGSNAFIIARNEGKLDASIEDLSRDTKSGRGVRGYPCDVSDRMGITTTIDSIASKEGGIDVLINNARLQVVRGKWLALAIRPFSSCRKLVFL